MSDIQCEPRFTTLEAGKLGEVAITNHADTAQRIQLGTAEAVPGVLVTWDTPQFYLEPDQRRVAQVTVRRRPFAYLLGGEVRVPLLVRGEESGSKVDEISVFIRPVYEMLSLRALLGCGGLAIGVAITVFVFIVAQFYGQRNETAAAPNVSTATPIAPVTFTPMPPIEIAMISTATPTMTMTMTATATVTASVTPSITPEPCVTLECRCKADHYVWHQVCPDDSWSVLYDSANPATDPRVIAAAAYNNMTIGPLQAGEWICLFGHNTTPPPAQPSVTVRQIVVNGTPSCGQPFTVTIIIANDGLGTAPATTLRIEDVPVNSPGNARAIEVPVLAIAPKGDTTITGQLVTDQNYNDIHEVRAGNASTQYQLLQGTCNPPPPPPPVPITPIAQFSFASVCTPDSTDPLQVHNESTNATAFRWTIQVRYNRETTTTNLQSGQVDTTVEWLDGETITSDLYDFDFVYPPFPVHILQGNMDTLTITTSVELIITLVAISADNTESQPYTLPVSWTFSCVTAI